MASLILSGTDPSQAGASTSSPPTRAEHFVSAGAPSSKGIPFVTPAAAAVEANPRATASALGLLSVFQEASTSPLNVSVDGSTPVSLAQGQFVYGLVPLGNHSIVATSGKSQYASGTVVLAQGENVTALVYLTHGAKPAITGFNNHKIAPPLGQSRVVVYNAADCSPVDAYLNGKLVASGLVNDPSSPQAVPVLIHAGSVSLAFTPAGKPQSNAVASDSGVLVAGDLLNVFLVGSCSAGPEHVGVLTNAIPLGTGYRLYASDGGVFDYGNASYFGSLGAVKLNKPVVGGTPNSIGTGYWMVASDGGVFAFGAAGFFGSAGDIRLNKPVVGMASSPSDSGYWLVASDGGVFTYGSAVFHGSTGNIRLNQPIVGMATTPDGNGYWLVASDGGVFSFGDALFYGSTGDIHLNRPIVAMVPTVDGKGYWLIASDGGVFSFGDARFFGSMGGTVLNEPVVSAVSTPDSQGYWLIASDGGVFSFGDASFYGSSGSIALNKPIVSGSAPGSPLPT